MNSDRPNPDDLLRQVAAEERSAKRGRLTIFFGAAPGVGKTYAMLEAARGEVVQEKRDVVIGIVETHGRYDTGALVLGLELLPRRKIQHRNIQLEELDLDAALQRRPALILVDELAHTNGEGSRHPKRWQDVEDLLDCGIDVYTTVNVQHVESLNDVVAQITGIRVRETVPDALIDSAHEIRVIDLPPDALLCRLKEGKVYLPDQAERAADNFFRKGNLIALRELALRYTAERVDAQVRSWKAAHGIEKTWATSDRLLVGVSPSPASARLVRAARRIAGSLHAPLLAVFVETPASLRFTAEDRERLSHNLRLAQQLGAETVTLSGENAAEETLRIARKRNVTKIVVGKPTHPRWQDLLRPSFLEQLVRASGDIDVYAISGDDPPRASAPPKRTPRPGKARPSSGYAAAGGIVAIATGLSWVTFGPSQLPDVVMMFLLGIVLVAMRFGYGPSLVAAILSVFAFDFFFVPPFYSFAVSDLRHLLTFVVMFVVAMVISGLTQRIRSQAEASRERENRTASLYAMSRELAAAASVDALLHLSVQHIAEVFSADVTILTPNAEGKLEPDVGGPDTFMPDDKEMGIVEWVRQHERAAGLGTDTLPSARAFYLPLRAGNNLVAVLGVAPRDGRRFLEPDQRQQLEAFAGQVASALARARLSETAQRAQVQVETEQLRNALLSSVSHDLRTPLAIITGSATALAEDGLDVKTRKDLLESIQEESHRLNRLVRNLLDMTRLQAGAVQVKKEWQDIEEVIGAVLTRMEDRLAGRVVTANVPEDLPMAPFDPILLEQVFVNLLENALKYTEAGTPIDISARSVPEGIEMEVADRGPGIPAAQVDRIFEKFYRAAEGKGGVGLGLTICRGIVTAHRGRLWVESRVGGGAVFRFTLPIEGKPPEVVHIPDASVTAEAP